MKDTDLRPKVQDIDVSRVHENKLCVRTIGEDVISRIAAQIKEVGFTKAVSAYQTVGDQYIIVAGHEVLYAARELGCEKVPVYVIDQPTTLEDELGIINSLAGEFMDWTAYEWGQYLYEGWIRMNKPDVKYFERMSISRNVRFNREGDIEATLRFFSNMPSHVKQMAKTGELPFSRALAISEWVRQLENKRPQLFASFSKEVILGSVIDKYRDGSMTYNQFLQTTIIDIVSVDLLTEFLGTRSYSFDRLQREADVANAKMHEKSKRALMSCSKNRERLSKLQPRTNEEWVNCLEHVKAYESALHAKLKKLEELEQTWNAQPGPLDEKSEDS